jgi:hypothetical protein
MKGSRKRDSKQQCQAVGAHDVLVYIRFQQVPGGPRIEGALFVSPKSPHYIPYVTIRVRSK